MREFFKKERKTNFKKMCHNGTRTFAHATRREGRKAWMGGDDVVCEGEVCIPSLHNKRVSYLISIGWL
jgi:hypothetical protein